MAESIDGLYKSELIHNRRFGPWRGVEDVELATLGWVDWWNRRRLHSGIGGVPPVEFEALWAEANGRATLGGSVSACEDGGGTIAAVQAESLSGLAPS